MNVASLERCKELYEVSGWLADENADHYWYKDSDTGKFEIRTNAEAEFYRADEYYPIYPLGYLLRKLPGARIQQMTKNIWSAGIVGNNGVSNLVNGDTPENCTAKLAIELFKQGVLTHD